MRAAVKDTLFFHDCYPSVISDAAADDTPMIAGIASGLLVLAMVAGALYIFLVRRRWGPRPKRSFTFPLNLSVFVIEDSPNHPTYPTESV